MTARIRRYLQGSPALARVGAQLNLTTGKKLSASSFMAMRYAGFDTEDYVIHSGIPNGRPRCEVRLKSKVGCGNYNYSDVPPRPGEVHTGAGQVWIPEDPKFATDGSNWLPSVGGGHTWTSGQAAAPYLDPDYSYLVRGGAEHALPAVVFDEGAWMALDSKAYSAQAFTLAIVAVLHLNPEGPVYGIVESYTPREELAADLASGLTDWGVRYRQGTVELWAGGVVAAHSVLRAQARPVVIVAAFGDDGGRFVVLDRAKSSVSFSTDTIDFYDSALYLGRTADQAAPAQTAVMDVLEFDLFDHALSFAEIDNLLHELDSCYGVVG